jgi:hypothetical protein
MDFLFYILPAFVLATIYWRTEIFDVYGFRGLIIWFSVLILGSVVLSSTLPEAVPIFAELFIIIFLVRAWTSPSAKLSSENMATLLAEGYAHAESVKKHKKSTPPERGVPSTVGDRKS